MTDMFRPPEFPVAQNISVITVRKITFINPIAFIVYLKKFLFSW